ncbi:MAG: peptidase G2 autoproteolytic cleavage domain-containing protein [Nanoarchaeota archaeon]|nr:peptidase G2 autoproteolytic cleavage domain-containing protein [Nanoarchaeota archaeon]
MAITQIISSLGTPPLLGQPQEEFDLNTSNFISGISAMTSEVNSWSTQANSTATNINDDVAILQPYLTDIDTVSSNISDINTAATGISNINTVATDIIEVGIIATNITNINTAATNNTNISTVATNITSVNNVSDNMTSVTNALANANNASDSASEALGYKNDTQGIYDDFDLKYLGSKSTAPTTDNQGNALIEGQLYYNLSNNGFYVYSGTAWVSATFVPTAVATTSSDGLMSSEDKVKSDNITSVDTTASGYRSTTIGEGTIASESHSIAMGYSTTAGGVLSTASGFNTTSSGTSSFSMGEGTIASYTCSVAMGYYTISSGAESLSIGANSECSTNYSLGLGCSSVSVNQTNSNQNLKILLNGETGNGYFDGAADSGNADYAEYFESTSGTEIKAGYFVSFSINKNTIEVGNREILGITSATPAIIGDSSFHQWDGKYQKDKFGRYLIQDVEVEQLDYIDDSGSEVMKTVIMQDRILNDDYNGDTTYIPREDRPEWIPIGLLGKLYVYYASTEVLSVGDYVTSDINGKAIKCNRSDDCSYRVIEVKEDLVRVLFK